MADLFVMPARSEDRREINIYRTPLPPIDGEVVEGLSRAFGVEGKVKDYGSRFVVEDSSSVLEIFEASGSIWWTRKTRLRSEPRESISLLSEEEAIVEADSYLRTTGIADKRARPKSVTFTEVLIEKSINREPIEIISQQHVNYEFSLDDLPIWGPGAKIQVTFGNDKQVMEVLKFWREPKQERSRYELISAEEAASVFQNDEAFADLSERTARIQVAEITLGYYALPPRESQACLIPVYRFEGFVSTEHLERYDFAKHVTAVNVETDVLKKMGGTITAAPLII
jgi:hypothetical protein